MPGNVLVAYGTTNGSTAQIAEAVAEVLRKEGLTAVALPAGAVVNLTGYHAVVVGGGLYAGRWHKDARRFVRRHRRAPAERPLWFFSSGPLDASASERDIPPVPGVRRAMTRLDPRGHVTFGGCLQEGQGQDRQDDRAQRQGWGLPQLPRDRGMGGARRGRTGGGTGEEPDSGRRTECGAGS